MGNKGGKNKNKRVSLPKARQILRKAHVWAIRPKAGAHPHKAALPLGEVIREKLRLANNRREIKAVLNTRQIWVDEKMRTNLQFAIGLFDMVRVDAEKKRYRVVFDAKGKLQLREMDAKEKSLKVCRIINKKRVGEGKFQFTTHDSRTFVEKNGKAKIGDSFVVELPSQKMAGHLSLKDGNLAYVISGTHVGTIGKIVKITLGTQQKEALVELQSSAESFQTVVQNLVVIGEKQPAIEVALPTIQEVIA